MTRKPSNMSLVMKSRLKLVLQQKSPFRFSARFVMRLGMSKSGRSSIAMASQADGCWVKIRKKERKRKRGVVCS
jgi:chloramphenicol 3-O-phosphotransferase